MVVEVHGTRWVLGHFWCNIYIACDVCASTASIFNLLAISLDRFITRTHLSHSKQDRKILYAAAKKHELMFPKSDTAGWSEEVQYQHDDDRSPIKTASIVEYLSLWY